MNEENKTDLNVFIICI